MDISILRLGKYQTSELVSNYLAEKLNSSVTNIDTKTKLNDTVIIVNSIYYGKGSKESIKYIESLDLTNKKVYLVLCAGHATEEYYLSTFTDKIVNMATDKIYAGGSMNPKELPLQLKFLSLFMKSFKAYDRIDYTALDQLAEEISKN